MNGSREAQFALYPVQESKTKKVGSTDTVDANGFSSLNMMAIQSRLTGKITGPDAFGAKSSGMIEGEFFGTANGSENGFRLRHAFVKLDWENTAFLIGQYWHPMFVTECFADVVSFNTGAPFQPFSRNPQIRLTQSFGSAKLIVALMSERDFPSIDLTGAGNTALQRNAVVPEAHVQLQVAADKSVFGAGFNYKSIRPNVLNDNKVSGIAGIAYANLDLGDLRWKVEGTYAQNPYNLMMIGGYASKPLASATSATEYMPTNTLAFWTELMTTGKDFQFGLFAGYTQNLGTADSIGTLIVGRGVGTTVASYLKSVMRVSPRAVWNSGKVRLAAEVEYSSAAYADPNAKPSSATDYTIDPKGVVQKSVSVSNVRVLLSAYLFF